MRWVRQLAQAAAGRRPAPEPGRPAGPRYAASHRPAARTAREQRPGLAHGSTAMAQPSDGRRHERDM
jgi:hypothetical protein